jgi:alpha-amylase
MNALLNTTQENKQQIVLYFQVHQPLRLKAFQFFDIGSGGPYFNGPLNDQLLKRIAKECYLPTNALLLKLIERHPNLRVTFSISGVTLDQFEEYIPEVLDSFKALASTGAVEFLAETNYHSLACMIPGEEFEIQVLDHVEKIHRHFGLRPNVFRNTELIYNNEIGSRVHALGFNGIFCDGIERVLNNQCVHQLFHHPEEKSLKIFPRNYRLSDDIAFRFSQGDETLTADQYLRWLNGIPKEESLICLAMDYETFGEHKKKESGIFEFLESVLRSIAVSDKFSMATPSEVIKKQKSSLALDIPEHISWADAERDLSAWLGNDIQRDAFESLLNLEKDVKNSGDRKLLKIWRYLQTSDHFYYMCTKKDADGNVHAYFSPYPSPYEAFMNYMNVLADFIIQVDQHKVQHVESATNKGKAVMA